MQFLSLFFYVYLVELKVVVLFCFQEGVCVTILHGCIEMWFDAKHSCWTHSGERELMNLRNPICYIWIIPQTKPYTSLRPFLNPRLTVSVLFLLSAFFDRRSQWNCGNTSITDLTAVECTLLPQRGITGAVISSRLEKLLFDWRYASLKIWTTWENMTSEPSVTTSSPYSAIAVLLGKAHKVAAGKGRLHHAEKVQSSGTT